MKVPKGASVSEVGDLLDEHGVVSSSTLFQMRVTLAGKRSELYPGTYTLAAGMSYGDAIDALSTPPVKRTITITIPEGLSRDADRSAGRDAGVSGDYLGDRALAAARPRRLRGRGRPQPRGLPLPGHLRAAGAGHRASSSSTASSTPSSERIAGVDLSYAKSKNLTVYDVLIIASMIEREVQIPKERRLVAAVIYNRLKRRIPLGIDATIRFAVGNYTEPLEPSELETDSPLQHAPLRRPAAGPDRQPG